MKQWTISLGYKGPTDSCLILTHPNGKRRQAKIESTSWKQLGIMANLLQGFIYYTKILYNDFKGPIYSNTDYPLYIEENNDKMQLIWNNWEGD